MRDGRDDDFDVAVIGGGLLGSALAWGLARAGQRVVVLDEGDVAFRASRGNFGLVWVQGKGLGMPEYAAWTIRSSEGWRGFAGDLLDATGIDVGFDRPGGFVPALSEAALEARRQRLAQWRARIGTARCDWEILERGALEKLLPHIGPRVAGASYCPLDGHVNALRLLRALHMAMGRAGVRYRPGHPVERIEHAGGGFRCLSPAGEVRAGKLVLAAGAANARLAPMVGLDAPVRPQRGQIIVTERAAPFLRHPLVSIRQTDEGGVLIGNSAEETGFDDRAGTGVAAAMAERAVEIFPLLGRLNVVRSWAALRVMTRDGFPIYEQSAIFPGAFLATCHSGVTLAANHALVLAPQIAAGALSRDLDAFSARRFDVPATA